MTNELSLLANTYIEAIGHTSLSQRSICVMGSSGFLRFESVFFGGGGGGVKSL